MCEEIEAADEIDFLRQEPAPGGEHEMPGEEHQMPGEEHEAPAREHH